MRDLGGYRTRVVDEGRGTPLVLVHGTPFDLGCFDALAAELVELGGHRVIRYDLRGHGSAADVSVAGIDVLAADLVTLLDRLDLPDAHLVGHSWGGQVVQRAALDRPDRVRRLSLLCTRASPFPPFADLARGLRAGTADPTASLGRWFTRDEIERDDPVAVSVRDRLRRVDVATWADALDAIAGFDTLGALPGLDVPTDVVAAEHDGVADPEHMARIADALPGGRLHVLRGARHLVPLQRPHEIATILTDQGPARETPRPDRFYRSGSTPFVAAQCDQRFSYALHVPEAHREATAPLPLVVVVHGTGRSAESLRDALVDFAERRGCVVLAPLFPAGIEDPDDLHNYKFLAYRGIRFDQVLLGMVDEVGARYRVRTDRFLLHGFSGGAQFAHRFLYLHPDRLAAASIAAPGRVTMIDPRSPWWLGTADLAERFGHDIDLDAVRRVAVQMVVGERDVETWEIHDPGGSTGMPGADASGRTRVERLRALHGNFAAHGIEARLDLVPGVGHSGRPLLPAVLDFLDAVLDTLPDVVASEESHRAGAS